MTMPVGIERKVRQLDNDVQPIYEMLAEIAATQRRQGNRLTEIDDRLTGMDSKLDETRGTVTGMDGKLETILGLLQGGRPD